MPLERFQALRERLLALAELAPNLPRHAELDGERPLAIGSRLTAGAARDMFESQLTARHLDRVAYELRARGQGFYTISSAGHEGNVVFGRALQATDPALLHYRSGALFLERARKRPESAANAIYDVMLGITASSEDPISGGRHKVFGSMPLCVLPQTSTIASQLPKAVGLALSLARAHRLGVRPRIGEVDLPEDALVITSMGDASINHASATVALNAARWVAFQRLPLPLLIVCEDNGLGLSVRTPRDWPAAVLEAGPSLPRYHASGDDLASAFEQACLAIEHCRNERRPVVFHLRCVRLMGHSGADPDSVYRSRTELDAALESDPLLASARLLLGHGILDGQALADLDATIGDRVWAAAVRAIARPKLGSAAEVMEPIAGNRPDLVNFLARSRGQAPIAPPGGARGAGAGGAGDRSEQAATSEGPQTEKPQALARLINAALFEAMLKYPHALLFGEDVAEKGGVYNVTAGLWKRFGPGRVFNTLLDETTILGLAQGAAAVGLLPIPEIQYLAFLHNAEDQLRGEAGSTSFFSRGQLRAPMVLRVASFGYQKGFGGHFHNDNSIAVLRDIPGLLLAVPSNGRDAVGLLRTLFAAAMIEGRVGVFLEPIALYNQRDLHERGDGLLAFPFPRVGEAISVGEVGVYEPDAADLTLATYGNGVRLCRRVALRLLQEHGVAARIVDLRWLKPLPMEALAKHARATRRLLFVDECRKSGNPGEGVIADLACRNRRLALGLVTAQDSYVPLGDAATLVLPSEADILEAALNLCRRGKREPRSIH